MRIVARFFDRVKLLGLAKGATLAAEATVTTVDADHNALDVQLQGTVPLPTGASTAALQTSGNSTLTSILARVTDVATGTKQDTGNASLASILAKIIAAPSTSANQDLILTAVNAVLAKIIAAPATEAKQDTGNSTLSTISGKQTDGTQIAIAKGPVATGVAPTGNPVYVAGIDGGGLTRPFLTSAAGNAQTAPAKGTSYASSSAEASKAYNSAQYPAKVRMLNGNASVRYFMMFNATSLPANGAIPVSEQVCAANGTGEIVFPIPTDRFGTGMVLANSSTATTLTIGSADSLFWPDFFPASA